MAVLAFAQPGQILLLTEGPRGDNAEIQSNVFQAGDHVMALYGDYQAHLAAFPSFAGGVSSTVDQLVMTDLATWLKWAGVGVVTAGFFPGGNPIITSSWFDPSAGGYSYLWHYPWVAADVSASVGAYFVRSIYTPFMTHSEGLDFIVFLGLQYAETYRSLGYADGYGIARLRTGAVMEWVNPSEVEPAEERARSRLRAAAKMMSGILNR